MRTSFYNIIVKVDEKAQKYAILNGYSRAFDIVNTDVYQYLKTGGEVCNISSETKEKLVKRGYVTSLSKEEEHELIKRLLDRLYDEVRLKKYSFHFILSYDCNLRCIYCYEDTILNGHQCLSKQKITKEQVDKAFDIIVKKDCNNEGKKTIALYGGEPFLYDNREMIEYIVNKGKRLGYMFTVTSNGYDIDKYLDFIENNRIFSFQITIDGIEEIHNARKPHFKNSNSFAKITSNVDSLLKLGIPVSIRINTDHYSMQRLEELIEYFKSRDWLKYKNFSSHCALLRNDVPLDKKELLSGKDFSQSRFFESFCENNLEKKSNGTMTCQDYKVKSVLVSLLSGKYVPYKSYFCGAQNGCLIFDPMGDVYSCWDVVGNRECRVGRYEPEFELDEQLSAKWFNSRVSKSKCARCRYVFFCGGGCLASSHRKKGQVQPGDCNDYPQLFNYELQQIYDEQIKKNFNE